MPLGQRSGDNSESRYCGTEVAYNDEIENTLTANLTGGFDFIVAPLLNPSYRPSKAKAPPVGGLHVPPFAGSDLILSPSQWSSHVVGKLSTWIDLDSENDILASDSEITLKQELSWASHLSLQACLLPTPPSGECANYARCVNQALEGLSSMQLWLRMPLTCNEVEDVESTQDEDAACKVNSTQIIKEDSWECWNTFRMLSEHHSQLSVALDITESLPSPNALKRWLGEPVRAAVLHTSAFLTNKRGYPCLSKRHQMLVTSFFNHNIQVVLSGMPQQLVDVSEGSSASEGSEKGSEGNGQVSVHPLRAYVDYISHLYKRMPPLTEQERFEMSYRDFLQAPLQPLMDNLEAQTYETFEKDNVKYSQYKLAIYMALRERVKEEDAETAVTVLMVVGAGRGPLVRTALEAAQEANLKLRVYAVEKNPNAVVTLHSLVALEGWKDLVTIVSCDMRSWEAPEKADILVSELLGSFGDNELSPECLDGAQRFLKKDGISIPSAYTSFIGPITAAKLYNDVKAHNDMAHFETSYVVKLHSVAKLCPPQSVFTFEHPNWSPKIDNRRYKKLTFEFSPDMGSAAVHGFGGYFDATLYKDVHLGIEPATATPDMFSWFPIYFPLRVPLYVPAGSTLVAHFWRCVSSTKVWYEWSVTSPAISPIHNPNGRSYWVGL
ncbi:hypothetical protein CBR_g50848 [Chara braunii]|uniref:Protein arginine N-methyltransferase n=1 Tax=Chara braunii TaxID=69332 RepID=A0A388M7P1_CHABU|nr:hypothetical protein CBR_g50848 [Chara braunii]|eukprot:GBG90503.1 hypothetical protein CBR_g50848 [Chara braunii]